LVRTSAERAQLKDSRTLTGQSVGDMVGDGDHLYLTLRPSYGYYYYYPYGVADSAGTSSEPETPSDTLSVVNLANDKLDVRFEAAVGNWGSQLMGLYDQRLFINISGDGMLAVDVSNPDAPVGQHFLRTLGYATHIAFQGDRAY